MTNHYIDFRNADVILIMGANPASNHPISFKWIMKAKEKGGKVVVVDPRFTQSASKADIYAPMRSGADIAFLGGMINFILQKNLHNEEYVKLYTDASFLVSPDFKGPGELNGVFSGLKGGKEFQGIGWTGASYDKATWGYQVDENKVPKKDMTLQSPNCVFQLMKQHYSRYTLDKVAAITGTPKDLIQKVYETYAETGKTGKAGTVLYAMGWTQHTVGTQNIRAMSMIQLLLANIGVAGGGVNALRGESNVQGSTDMGLLFHILPGYVPVPRAANKDLAAYNEANTPKSGDPMSLNWWGNRPKYLASYLRAMWGTSDPIEVQYQYLPKMDDLASQNAKMKNGSWLVLFDQMLKGAFKGFFAWGQNPACSSANANKVRAALAKLEWMVNVNLFDNETGSFWKGPGMKPADVKTEVFMLPCAASYEKEGSITNSGRWAQWRYKAVGPPGEAKPDAEIMNELFHKVRDLYKKDGGAFPDPVVKLSWAYGFKNHAGVIKAVDVSLVAKEVNGYFLEDVTVDKGKPTERAFKKGDPVPSFAFLQADGTTSSGCWIFCQSFNADGNNMARRVKADPSGVGLFPRWAWSWPVNRRIIYNRASVDGNGKPWDKSRPTIWWTGTWDAKEKKWNPGAWAGDVPDGAQPPLLTPDGTLNKDSKWAFIMKTHGFGTFFGNATMAEGPFPEHYEPLECPTEKNLMSNQKINPVVRIFGELGVTEPDKGKYDRFLFCDPKFPYIASTYRVTEHWQTGLMTRHVPSLVELMPANFVEMNPELAREKGIKNGEIVSVSSARGAVDAVAIVTNRLRPFQIGNEKVHQVGLCWHFGWATTAAGVYGPKHLYATFGDSANLLTPTVGDANTMIPESKAFMVNIERKGVA
jgi:formate dehydrogenase major subunit